ncbi:unnamed protein product, partial [Amoebophrya sp. A120]|eukprot:GSA120T00000128001.1
MATTASRLYKKKGAVGGHTGNHKTAGKKNASFCVDYVPGHVFRGLGQGNKERRTGHIEGVPTDEKVANQVCDDAPAPLEPLEEAGIGL